jgi:hypothetical protein
MVNLLLRATIFATAIVIFSPAFARSSDAKIPNGIEFVVESPSTTILQRSQAVWEKINGMDLSDELMATNELVNIATEFEKLGILQNSNRIIKKDNELALTYLVQSRMILRQKLKEREAQVTLVSPSLVSAIRKFSFFIRGTEEMIGESLIGFAKLKKKEKPISTLSGGFPNLLIHAPIKKSDVELKSGDVLVTRGNAHTSSAIAQFGVENSPYSHNVLIYIDPVSGKKFGLQSLIEDGLVIHDLEKILNEGYGRVTLMRHPDAQLAHKAASIVYELAFQAMLERQKTGKTTMPYDFTMEIFKRDQTGKYILDPVTGKKIPDYSNVFCSKVIVLGFERASRGQFIPGKYWNRLPQQTNGEFLSMLGVTANDTFLPSDLEVDTRFDIVADWRDYRVTPDLRIRESVSYALFDWIENEGYRFRSNRFTDVLASLAKNGSQSKLLSKLLPKLAAHFPYFMSKNVIKGMILLTFTSDVFYKDITNKDLTVTMNRQAPYSFYEIQKNLLAMRAAKSKDLKYFKK